MAKQKHQQREAYEPLLVNHGEGEVDTAVHDLSTTKKVVKRILEVVMWLLFAAWVAVIFCSPSESVGKLVESWIIASASGSFYGITGAIFLVFSGPILAIAFLAVACLIIHGEGKSFPQKKSSKDPKFRLRTFPLLVDGPLGVVSAAEFIGICLFVVFSIWAIYAYTMRNLSLLSELHVRPQLKSTLLLELSGLRFGSIGLYCLAFLFLPVARGSVLLRVTDIPFEQATRYHVWLGHMTMLFFTLHGAFYLIAWALEGRLLNEILGWKDVGVANLPGVISLLAGLLMWVTSLSPVRKKQFELFFYTHQLYVAFVVFLALHVGDFIFSIAAGGVFLFIMDRFLRFCQSRRTVDIISATCLPCGTVELTLSKPGSLQYNALSFIFLQIQELSWLQWHPFSVSSSPLNRMNNLSVLIKVLGGWTAKLKGSILDISESKSEKGVASQSFSKITASVEGPYGHEFPYHLTYENLILVAGGVGISPFFAILSDILHLITEGRPCLPKNVLVLWAIKKSDELPLLSALDMESICPTFPDKLNLEVRVYITRESEPQVEEGEVYKGMSSSVFPVSSGCGMSVLVGTGNRTWSGVYVISSMVGFAILMGLLDIFYINPRNIYSWWYKGLLFVVCMVASVVIFGGIVICLWHHWSKGIHSLEDPEVKRKDAMRQQSAQAHPYVIRDNAIRKDHASLRSIYYGSRPNFKDIFSSVSECWGNVDVGVIVCGPPTLQSSVAKECRSQNLRRGPLRPIFHFNSHSFDL